MDDIIIDLNNCENSSRNGRYGGMAGSKEGIIFNNDYWIVKYSKSTKSMDIDDLSYTTSPLSEYIGSHIYKILGYDVHETFLGYRNNKVVVACKDFCDDKTELREIRTLKNIYNEDLQKRLETELDSTGSTHMVDFQELMIHLEYNPVLSQVPGLKERFWECAIIDLLINNNDRNNGNWGLLYRDGSYSIAPVFDNGASFSNKLGELKINDILCHKQKLEQSSLNIDTAYGINNKRLTMHKFLNLENIDLNNALKKVIPLIREKMPEIKNFIDDIPESYKNFLICSKKRKEIYKAGMQLRLEKVLEQKLEKLYAEELNNYSIVERTKNAKKNKQAKNILDITKEKIVKDR